MANKPRVRPTPAIKLPSVPSPKPAAPVGGGVGRPVKPVETPPRLDRPGIGGPRPTVPGSPLPKPLPQVPGGTPGAVDPAERDAAIILGNLFESYGLGSLAPKILDLIKQGYSADAISVLLMQTDEYKKRFSANEIRIKNGLPALSPAEYIATERSYRQVMSEAGLPVGFYDKQDDFTKFLASDVSPTELKGRVDIATEAVRQAPPETMSYFKQWYNEGDIIAYALDPTKAAPLIDQRIRAAESAGVAKAQGLNLNQSTAEQLGANKVSLDQARQGFGFIGQDLPTAQKLSGIYGGPAETQDDMVQEVFFNDGKAAAKRRNLASKERASFSGSSATGEGSLNKGQQF
jgi:hypothetical protein